MKIEVETFCRCTGLRTGVLVAIVYSIINVVALGVTDIVFISVYHTDRDFQTDNNLLYCLYFVLAFISVSPLVMIIMMIAYYVSWNLGFLIWLIWFSGDLIISSMFTGVLMLMVSFVFILLLVPIGFSLYLCVVVYSYHLVLAESKRLARRQADSMPKDYPLER